MHEIFCLFLSSNLLVVFLLQSLHNIGMGAYKVFNLSSPLLPSFPTRNQTQTQLHILYYNSSFVLDTNSFSFVIFKRLYHISFKLYIVNISNAQPPGLPEPIEGFTVCPDHPVMFYFSIHTKHIIFSLPGQRPEYLIHQYPILSQLNQLFQ